MLLSNDIFPGHMDHPLQMNEDVEDEKNNEIFPLFVSLISKISM